MWKMDKSDLSTVASMESVVMLIAFLVAVSFTMDQASNHNVWVFITVMVLFATACAFMGWLLGKVGLLDARDEETGQ